MSIYGNSNGGDISPQQYIDAKETQNQYVQEHTTVEPSAPKMDRDLLYQQETNIVETLQTNRNDVEDQQSNGSQLTLCICGLLSVVIVVLICLIYCKGRSIRSRLSTKSEQVLYFSRPGCGYCTKFNPTWDQFENLVKLNGDLNKRFQLRKIDCTDPKTSALCVKEREYGMQGVPHIVRVLTNGEHIKFSADRTVENLMKFINNTQ
jgi:hypothetical protein